MPCPVCGGLICGNKQTPGEIFRGEDLVAGVVSLLSSLALRNQENEHNWHIGEEEESSTISEYSGTTASSLQSSEQNEVSESVETEDEETDEETHKNNCALRLALQNVQSVNENINSPNFRDKHGRITNQITENNLNIYAITETFPQSHTIDEELRHISPQGYNYAHYGRTEGRRGVATLFRQDLQGEQFANMDFITTFEYVATRLYPDGWDQPLLFITLYRPPGFNVAMFEQFLSEFEKLLDTISSPNQSIIVAGDFNIHVDNVEDPNTQRFEYMLECNNLEQHVRAPTHWAGHTLDLVITRNVEISDIRVQDYGISDHYTVFVTAKPVKKRTECVCS